MRKIKKYTVDGITVLGLWINNQFVTECEVQSDFSEKEIREYLRNY